jgi:hypothetical protein
MHTVPKFWFVPMIASYSKVATAPSATMQAISDRVVAASLNASFMGIENRPLLARGQCADWRNALQDGVSLSA